MNFVRHSPSSLNLFASQPSLFVLEKILGKRQPVGAAAHRGTAVEDGVAFGLDNPDAPLEDCVEVAMKKWRTLMALNTDPRREKSEGGIAGLVEQGLAALRPYGKPSSKQGSITWHPEGLKYPIFGYYDFMFEDHGIVVDLKTSDRLPSEIKTGHARQVALYTSGNLGGRLAYTTPQKHAVYDLENVAAHRNTLFRMAVACERFLSLSDDPEFFVSITLPDLDSFWWSPPQARQAAWDTWQI